MPNYRRPFVPGGTFFFTVVTAGRMPLFVDADARRLFHRAIAQTRRERPFDLIGFVLLHDHLHAIWTLPDGDADISVRWAAIKARFTRAWLERGGTERRVTTDRARHRGRGVWQNRFWDHCVRDQDDLNAHLDYLHYNPVKHGYVRCPHDWPYSTFSRWVERGAYDPDWLCSCGDGPVVPPRHLDVPTGME